VRFIALGTIAIGAGALIAVSPMIFMALLAALIFLFVGFLSLKKFFLVILFLIPFLPALNLAPGMDVASARPLILLLFALFIVRGAVRRELKIPVNTGALLVFAFLAWTTLSLLYSSAPDRTARKLMVFLSIFPLFFVVYGLHKRYGHALTRSIFFAVGISALVASMLGIVQFGLQFVLGGDAVVSIYSKIVAPVLWGITTAKTIEMNPSWYFNAGSMDILRAFSSFPDPHVFSYFLSFGLPVQVAIAVLSERKVEKAIFYLSGALSLVAVFLTFSRGGYIGLVAGVLFAICCVVLKNNENKLQTMGKVALVTGIIVLGVASSPNPISNRFASMFDVYEGSNQGRIKIWREAYEVFQNNPLLGAGLGAYSFEVKPSADYREPIYAHNLYLELLAETGLPGFLLWISVMAISGYTCMRIFFSATKKRAVPALALLTTIVWFSVHSFFEMPVYSPVILPLLITVLAIISYWSQEEGRSKNQVADGF